MSSKNYKISGYNNFKYMQVLRFEACLQQIRDIICKLRHTLTNTDMECKITFK